MKILHLSDTHGKHHLITNLPPSDLIIHSGDLSENGTEDEVLDFMNWFSDLDYKYKIFIAGNHDFCLDGEQVEGLPANCHFLSHSGVEIEGLSFWGVPDSLSAEITGRIAENIAHIPPKLDFLISHKPPYGILDFEEGTHWGCLDLLNYTQMKQPRYHLFGHIHDSYGIVESPNTTFVNSSMIRDGRPENAPHLVEIGADELK